MSAARQFSQLPPFIISINCLKVQLSATLPLKMALESLKVMGRKLEVADKKEFKSNYSCCRG
jgi:hypothetical protein